MERVTYYLDKRAVKIASGDLIYEDFESTANEREALKSYQELVAKNKGQKIYLVKIQETVIKRSDK